MTYCAKCGSSLAEGVKFCTRCGNETSVAMAATASASTIVMMPAQAPLWYSRYATGQTSGPWTEDEIRAMIARQQIKISDAVAVQGGSTWLPITQSPFAGQVAAQTSIDRLASSTCPRCGGAMIVVLRRSGASKAFFITGLLTIWMFGFGIIFIIIGYIVGRNPGARYECPRCRYRAG